MTENLNETPIDNNNSGIDENNIKNLENNSHNNSTKNIIKFTIVIFTLSLIIAALTSFYAMPKINENKANDTLKNLQNNYGSIRIKNNENISGITYFNGKDSITNRRKVEVFLPLDEAKSKDFINLNSNMLKSLTEAGKIELTVHPIADSSINSMLTSEAFYSSIDYPEKSFDWLGNLTKLTLSNNKNDSGKIISDRANKLGLDKITTSSLNGEKYGKLLYNDSHDVKATKAGVEPPIIYVDNKLIDPQKVNINDPTILERVLNNE